MRTLSLNALQAMLAQETDEVFLTCVTVDHADLDAPVRLVDDRVELERSAGTFVPFPFMVTLPASAEDELPQARLVADNVDRTLVEAVRSLETAPDITVEIVTASAPDTVELACEFTAREVTTDAAEIQFVLGFEDVLNESYPALTFTPAATPGLF